MHTDNDKFELRELRNIIPDGPVFFGTPDLGELYPTPKLADFGSSRNLGDPGVKSRGDVVRRDACCMLFAPPVCNRSIVG